MKKLNNVKKMFKVTLVGQKKLTLMSLYTSVK